MNWLDLKYTTLLSNRLERFKKVDNKYNFRCPVCGDSKTSKTKARAWIFSKGESTRFGCFNCGASMSFPKFLKWYDSNLFGEYVKEKYVPDESSPVSQTKEQDRPKTFDTLDSLKTIEELQDDHPAKKYILSRKIPDAYFSKLRYAPKFKTWANTAYPNKFKNIDKDEPRLIIPLLDRNGDMFGFQGRSFKKNDDLKYITIMLEDRPKIFGLDTVSLLQSVYMFEGPIDSMFIPNSLASAGGKIDVHVLSLGIHINDVVIVYDNEPRSVTTVKKMMDSIKSGFTVCIWPSSLKHKDVNDMILSGLSPEEVKSIIDANSYSGIMADLKLAEWRKC